MKITLDHKSEYAFRKIKDMQHKVQVGIRHAYYRAGVKLKKYTSDKMMEKPKSGRKYYVVIRNRPRVHIASAPWEYPANMTGALRKSLAFKVHGYQRLEYTASTPYAKYIERGTDKMGARKFLRESVIDNLGNIRVYITEEIKKQLDQV